MPKTAVIVIDAVELSVLQRLMDAGHLPHLSKLAGKSARFELRSPLPYRSEMVWTRFLTGKDSPELGY
jgi:predicted AlkP superfamily phosphohydrolase/phosphomutase